MAAKSSAEKRHRQSEVARMRNRSTKSAVRTSVKNFLAAVKQKDEEKAKELYRLFVKKIDTAAGKRIIHKNTAARKKSRMAAQFNATFLKK
jgi:small subunit ribosomal protein S20